MLAISTATKTGLIALDVDGEKYYISQPADCRQSEKMMFELHKLLTKIGKTLSDAGNIALVIGPGSFTGLRIGAALVKGFCAGDPQKMVVPIGTLDLMAKQIVNDLHPHKKFSCYMNAQSGMFYSATFEKNGKKVKDDHLESADEILKGKESKYCLAEEGFLPYGITLTPEVLLKEALVREKNGEVINAKDIQVKYIRRSQAEEKA